MLLIVMAYIGQIHGQQQPDRSLKIGDRLPFFDIPNLINSPSKTINTSVYADKLLIIDFWGTGCSSCVEALPRMEKLQRKYDGKVVILPVTPEKSTYVKEFLKNNHYTKKIKMQVVVDDKILNQYFKYQYISHEVWIYKGKVVAITGLEYVDDNNIGELLSGKVVDWPLKYDFDTFDVYKPLFKIDKRQVDELSTPLSYAAISDYRERFSSATLPGKYGVLRDSIKKNVRFYSINGSIFNTYLFNWQIINRDSKLTIPNGIIRSEQVLWEVSDRSRYKYERILGYQEDWIRKNGICFESVYPDHGQNDKEISRSVVADLDRLLGLHVRWEKRREMTLVLTKSGINMHKTNDRDIKGESYNIANLVYMLNEHSSQFIFNETGDQDGAEIRLATNFWKNISSLTISLKEQGYTLKQEERIVDKFIFSEVNGSKLVDPNMRRQARLRRDSTSQLKSPPLEDNKSFLIKNKINYGVRTTQSGLQYKILKEGIGKMPKAESKVLVNYEGRLVNGKIFDSSYESGRTFAVRVNNVIPGWTEALKMMKEGSKWELYVPAELAYGEHTGHGKVPMNSTLIFDIELVKIND